MKNTPDTPRPARERMLEATIGLLRQSGLAGAGINEIVARSAAPKGSVYHYFPAGKNQLAREALTLYQGRVLAFMRAAMVGKRTPEAKVKALFAAFARRLEEGDFQSSCAAGTVILDLTPPDESLREVVESMFGAYVAEIAEHFSLENPARTALFARFMLTAIEGSYIRGRAERSGRAFIEAGRWLAELVQVESSCDAGRRKRSRTA